MIAGHHDSQVVLVVREYYREGDGSKRLPTSSKKIASKDSGRLFMCPCSEVERANDPWGCDQWSVEFMELTRRLAQWR